MERPDEFIDRVGYVDEICARVSSYNVKRKKYIVTPLPCPNSAAGSIMQLEVDRESLEFFPAKSFQQKFPFAKCVSGSSVNVDDVPHGTVVNLSGNSLPKDLRSGKEWTVTTSSRIIGEPTMPAEFGSIYPTTSICNEVTVKLNNANDMVEFEDILFSSANSSAGRYAVECSAGRSITFRRCRFTSSGGVVQVYSNVTAGKKKNAIRVVFENCLFENSTNALLQVGSGGQVRLIYCKFSSELSLKPPTEHENQPSYGCHGICVWDGGSVLAQHCSFTKLWFGVQVTSRPSTLDAINCTFQDVSDAIYADFGGTVNAKGCRITECTIAFALRGPQRSNAYIDTCVVQKCGTGIRCRFGKTDVIAVNSELSCTNVGLFVNWDVVGNVDIVDCSVVNTEKADHNFVDRSTEKCTVTVNGVVRPSKPMKTILAMVNKHLQNDSPLLHERKCFKMAGVCDVSCFNCGAVEPRQVKFKVCAGCKSVCYCCKECQVAHWESHQDSCYSAQDNGEEDEEEEGEEGGEEQGEKDVVGSKDGITGDSMTGDLSVEA